MRAELISVRLFPKADDQERRGRDVKRAELTAMDPLSSRLSIPYFLLLRKYDQNHINRVV